MKRCGRCGDIKPIEDFGFRNKIMAVRHSVCKQCQAIYRAEYNERHGAPAIHARIRSHTIRYRNRNRKFLDDYLRAHPCVDCGLSDPVVLEFDHVFGLKRAALSVMCRNAATIATLRAEIEKCVVRCANCHRRRTAKSRGYWKHNRQENDAKPPELSRSPAR